jgi:hypothetical protein
MTKGEVTKKDQRIVAELIAQGWPLTAIARLLGVTMPKLRERIAEDDRLAAAVQEGRDRQEQALVNSLFQRAINLKDRTGNVCAMFLLKSRFNYVDRGDGNVDDRTRVNIVLNIPAPLQPEQYRKLIDVRPALDGGEPDPIGTVAETIEVAR